ncbi:unnamed protein product [Candida verbasci]|uniref:C2H2-type domain-containing protein n=1 Tax=Candida verbasci TaxID=1227364 RepID=A0A9W4XIP3_9ASCO|nr:unnamed protein product [Candida verbasci]
MLFQQLSFNNPTQKVDNNNTPNTTSLPSFSELLISIPSLPLDFKKQIITSPPIQSNNNYIYSKPLNHHQSHQSHHSHHSHHSQPFSNRLPTPPLSSTKTQFDLAQVREIKERDPKRKHVCKVCTRSFTTSGHLARHNRIHTGERKHLCPWPTCNARFARQDNCMQHYKTHTNGKNKRRSNNVNNNNYTLEHRYDSKALV